MLAPSLASSLIAIREAYPESRKPLLYPLLFTEMNRWSNSSNNTATSYTFPNDTSRSIWDFHTGLRGCRLFGVVSLALSAHYTRILTHPTPFSKRPAPPSAS